MASTARRDRREGLGPRRPLGRDDLEGLLVAARLEVEDHRKDDLAVALTGVLAMAEALDVLDLAELPPAPQFDAGWEA